MRQLLISFLALTTLLVGVLFSCQKDKSGEPGDTPGKADIYVAGSLEGKGRGYWKNGTFIQGFGGRSIAVSGSDVYMTSEGGYWKNGNPIPLEPPPVQPMLSDIVISGSDIYVAGTEGSWPNRVAKYWKNGQAIALTDGTKDASASFIAVAGSDVYVAGGEYNGSYWVAKYWKNGTAVPLAFIDGSQATAEPFDIAVSGNDIYVAGYILSGNTVSTGYTVSTAVYWKNGTPVTLGNGAAYGVAVVP